ncbi:MAG: rhomboid family intramembrane serine protease [Methanomassiliicoccaceae archaeon]|jgi:membrane associated rhomboid family serine protease|nr:rhomboid family intramembrane serine protease [Methanomassiliicoccaceae archaeon]
METVSLIAALMIAAAFAVLALRKHSPTMVLVASNVIVYAIGIFGGEHTVIAELGFKSDLSYIAQEPWTIITSMFVHADLLHLMFNMLFLLIIGMQLESRVGRWRFLAIYVIGGIAGTFFFSAVETVSNFMPVILIGASGAISALFGAMLVLYPEERMLLPVGIILTNRFTVRTAALVWFAMQLILMMLDSSPIAYLAHIGGFLAGAGIAWAIRPKQMPDRGPRKAPDISPLKRLCTTVSLKEMYGYAETARDDETRTIWTERILRDVVCPVCGSPIRKKGGGFECTDGHRI